MLAYRAADGNVIQANLFGLLGHSLDDFLFRRTVQARPEKAHSFDCPKEIDGGRAGFSEGFAHQVEIGSLRDSQCHTHRRGHANGRSASDHHGADRLSDFLIGCARYKYLFARKTGLIDHDHAFGGPFNCFNHEIPFSLTGQTKSPLPDGRGSTERFCTIALRLRHMLRKRFEWKLRERTLSLGDKTLVVGVLNVTPDSFSDGGKYSDPDRAFARAVELEEQGADILDIGAESTKPGSARISEAEELRRLVPVLKRLKGKLTIPISVDTYKASVAEKALELGVEIINDPSALTFDAELARAVVQGSAGLILNHMRGTPETWTKLPPLKDAIRVIAGELDAAVHRAIRAGMDRKHLVVDPGLGFGKRKEQNAEILAQMETLRQLEMPVMVGPSRKHFLAKESSDETEFATAAAVTAAILHGAHLVRVHDVKAMRAVVEVADEIARSGADAEPSAVGTSGSGVYRAARPRSS